MADENEKRPDMDLFRSVDAHEEIRTILRTTGGMTEHEVARIQPSMLSAALHSLRARLDNEPDARAVIERDVAAGKISRSRADAMTAGERLDYYCAANMLQHFHSRKPASAPVVPPLPDNDQISRTETLYLVAQLIAISAAQQEQIRQLRDEVAEAKNAHIAAFGKHALVDQIIKAERDIEGFEVSIELEEQASVREEGETTASTETSSSNLNARDTHAAIDGLAKQVVGLDVGRKLNVEALEKSVKSMKDRAAREVKVRQRGHVHMKFGKVSGGGRAPGGGTEK